MDLPHHPPVIVHNRADIAGLLADRRRSMGMTCEAFDYHAGFTDRYVTKLEHGDKPGMKQAFHIMAGDVTVPPDVMDRIAGLLLEAGFSVAAGAIRITAMAEVWLEACGLSFVIMDNRQADEIGAKRIASKVVAK